MARLRDVGPDLQAVRVAADVTLDLRRLPCGYRLVLVPSREDPHRKRLSPGRLHQQSSWHPHVYAPRASCTLVKIARST